MAAAHQVIIKARLQSEAADLAVPGGGESASSPWRRFTVSAGIAYAGLHQALMGEFNICASLKKACRVQWIDPEGDRCSMSSDEELAEALGCLESSRLLRVIVVVPRSLFSTSTTAPPPASITTPPPAAATVNDDVTVSPPPVTTTTSSSTTTSSTTESPAAQSSQESDASAFFLPPPPTAGRCTAARAELAQSLESVSRVLASVAGEIQQVLAPFAREMERVMQPIARTVEQKMDRVVDDIRKATTKSRPATTTAAEEGVAPPPPRRHDGVQCANCLVAPIVGSRFLCMSCADVYNLCAKCEAAGVHPHHAMVRLRGDVSTIPTAVRGLLEDTWGAANSATTSSAAATTTTTTTTTAAAPAAATTTAAARSHAPATGTPRPATNVFLGAPPTPQGAQRPPTKKSPPPYRYDAQLRDLLSMEFVQVYGEQHVRTLLDKYHGDPDRVLNNLLDG